LDFSVGSPALKRRGGWGLVGGLNNV